MWVRPPPPAPSPRLPPHRGATALRQKRGTPRLPRQFTHIKPSPVVILIIALYLLSSIKILREYARGVIFRPGRPLDKPNGPGISLVLAPADRMVRSLQTLVEIGTENNTAVVFPPAIDLLNSPGGLVRKDKQEDAAWRRPSWHGGRRRPRTIVEEVASPVSSRLSAELCGIPLRNPVLAASGTFAYGIEFESVLDLEQVGGIVVKGLSREPMDGNPQPRVYEAEAGMINSIGLQNIGVRAFVADKLPALRRHSTPVFANAFGYEIDDYVEVVRVLNGAGGLAAYELNVSCPNTKHGGIFFSSDPVLLAQLVSAVKRIATRPVIVKLSPNVASIPAVAKAAEDAGADAISLVNTFISLALDPRTRKPRLGAGFGGLSGPAIKPVALRMVHEAWRTVKIPVIGLGGIGSGEDAAEFMIAGATAVQVGTATFWDPRSPVRIARELDAFLQNENIASVRSLTGTLDWNRKLP